MMTYTQPSSYSNYDPFVSTKSPAPPQGFYRSSSNAATSQANPRTLPPYISLQRASEPASPATIATTISSHSTPSPSPSRPTNMPTAASNTDFTLFDDAMMAVAQDVNTANSAKARSALDAVVTSSSSSIPENPAALTTYASSGFPIIVPHDVPYQSYAHSTMYGNYSGNYSSPDTTSNFYTLGPDQQVASPHQRQPQTNARYLRPVSYSNNQNSAPRQRPISSQLNNEVEPVENVPVLSPAKRQANSGYPSGSSTYLHSAMPKLGRTFSDAIQDELYTPEQARDTYSASQGTMASPQKNSLDSKHSFPHIFHEAQQQHQQAFSHSGSPQQLGSRDRSPFRHNSPFHPTNNSNLPHAIGQNQLAMALAIEAQMGKEAPKTISPRESLLEFQEPESQSSQMGLFPQIQDPRATGPHDDSMSNGGSLHASSHDGSDLEDFQSMATSRRASMANSTVSSHLDRFGYIQQPAFEPLPTNPYYYADANTLGASSLPLGDATNTYLKEEIQRNPITRPLDTSANTGTYTCTFSGCGQRFTTSTKLQKHRREAHRKSVPSGNSVSSAAAIACRNAQPGPHRCMRINPSTGKPCNTVFSRPYDLTRHEDTIHNTAKAKVRCEICDDDKFFSRSDALVRHRRVKHGIH
ncbi:hypothetical protein TWF718_007971 [Orbilia javanica]|uniref:C2H2-type domain-containing protein n=1 Tax=Orbilia javanica TaxID=47235 RepID=A0AAN8RMM3_9PEZI